MEPNVTKALAGPSQSQAKATNLIEQANRNRGKPSESNKWKLMRQKSQQMLQSLSGSNVEEGESRVCVDHVTDGTECVSLVMLQFCMISCITRFFSI